MSIIYLTATKDLKDRIDCDRLLRQALEIHGGKGGGNGLSASGKTEDVEGVIQFLLDALEAKEG